WLSTMGLAAEQGAGSLYRLHHGKLTCLLSGLSIPNALCFSEDGRYAYFTDTPTGRIMRWQLDAEGWPYRAGSGYAAPCVWSDLRDAGGNPDGAVIDSEGCMWVALWGAGRVIHLDQKGRETGHVALPASQPSCPLFGGHALDTLYITTAHEGLDAPGAADGSLYAIDLSTQGVRGVEEPRLVLD
ncbi:MAG: SMP-30/gluconolactonase/LRE family protein, partial [Halomonas sp.]